MVRQINSIVIHHSGNTDTVEDIRNLHVNINKWDDIGYHFMIDREGSLVIGRDIDKIGAHVYGFNEDSIGICLLGNFDFENIEEKQLDMLRWLLKKLISEFSLNKESIKFHRDFPNVAKSCPGLNIIKELIFV